MAASLGVSQHRSTAWHSLRAVGKLVSSGGCLLALFWDGIAQNDPSSRPKTSVRQEFTAPGIRMYVVLCAQKMFLSMPKHARVPRYAGKSHFDSACMRVQLKTGGNSLEKGVYPKIFASGGGLRRRPAAPRIIN
jgi:hypothetical protein